jgi:hypothetical protein
VVRALGLAATAWASQACLVEAPPEFEAAPRRAPTLSMDQAVPPTNAPLEVERNGPPITISVPIAWDGAGDSLLARLYLDLNTDRELQLTDATPAAPPEVQMTWQPDQRITVGCHRLTLVVTHQDNYNTSLRTPKPIDAALASSVTWWAAVDTPAVELPLAECAPSSGVAP